MSDFPYDALDRYITDEDYGKRRPKPLWEDMEGYDPDADRENREELQQLRDEEGWE